MEKTTLQKLAELFGFRINADAIEEISVNQERPDDWDEMSEDEQAAWEAKQAKMTDNSSDDEPKVKPARKPVQNARQTQARVANQDPDVTNLLKLNSLIDEIGGFDAYKGLLLSAVEAVENYQMEHNQERDGLVAQIVANSAGSFEAADLQDMEIPVLKKMAQAFGHDVTVDYSMLNPSPLKTNKEDFAPLPNIASLFNNKKED
jgi:hypothetical protein